MPHSAKFVRLIRDFELDAIANKIPKQSKILELGAGAGWQARKLNETGHDVIALEYSHPGFQALRDLRVFNIEDYDGINIPYPNASFDVVFSSNMLEHAKNLDSLQLEIYRVLRKNGVAIHLVPSPAWRIWSWVTHYLFGLKQIYSKLLQASKRTRNAKKSQHVVSKDIKVKSKDKFKIKLLLRNLSFFLVPERHGEDGNFLTEVFYFSKMRWIPVFKRAGFTVIEKTSVGLFYSGYGVLGEMLSIKTRERLGRYLGRATSLYMLKK